MLKFVSGNPFANLGANLKKYADTIVYPKIDQKMRSALEAGQAEAVARCPVDTGQLKASIGYIYDQATRVGTLYADQPYASFQELGWRRPNGTIQPPHPFLRPGLAAMGRVWGGTTAVQFTGLAPQYHARTVRFASKKFGKAKLILGHRR